jgi:hypothetical protein
MLQAGRSLVIFPLRSLDFFNLPNPSGRTMALKSTQSIQSLSLHLSSGTGEHHEGPEGE